MFPLQRSIPFPPIRLERLAKYLQEVVQRGSVELDELKREGVDFGKGKGDITRFLERLGLVSVSGKTAAPTKLAYEVLSMYRIIGNAAFHPLFYAVLLQYRLLSDIMRDLRVASIDELHEALNKRVAEISPSSWINNVAFRSLVAIAVDIGLLGKKGKTLEYLGDPVSRALASAANGALIGKSAYMEEVPEWLKDCVKVRKPLGVVELDPECTSRVLERRILGLMVDK
ncbi:MAG: hypothetical protein ABWJ97_06815 [Thermoproteus sp.]